MVAYLLFSPPQIPIKKYIGISNASKKINNDIKSPARKTPFTEAWSNIRDPRNPLLRPWFSFKERIESNTNKQFKVISKKDIPDRPKVKLIPYALIQENLSTTLKLVLRFWFKNIYKHKPKGIKLKKIVKGLKSSALLFGIQNIKIVLIKGIRTKITN